MDEKALSFICRFSLPPNFLGYCGKDSAPEKFKSCVIDGKCRGVAGEFEKFIVLHPYLRTLGKIADKPKFSKDTAEAYWLGSSLLKKVRSEDYDLLLKCFSEQGVPEWLIEELKNKRPAEFIPTHLFQVLHVGVGRASGSVPYNIKTINNCMIRWGEVTEIKGNKVVAELNSLKSIRGHYVSVINKVRAKVVPGFLPRLKKGDTVAIHWGQAVKKLTAPEIKKLEYWTARVLETF